MKSFGALILAAFYLILNSGISACFSNCCTDLNFASSNCAQNVQNTSSCDKDHCNDEPFKGTGDQIKSKACDCCGQRAAFTVKESIAGSLEIQLEILQNSLISIIHSQENGHYIDVSQENWPIAKGPPGVSKPFLYILNSSFLI
ncbi:MAG: hypothetical protein C0191_00515 [Mucilaginibacter sp.]|nr:MAG: hypothetical protein C0191_00515 [Mucilaginibacter sp.]HEK21350.1 hypothetical protein [Bacteroidota bacterium]